MEESALPPSRYGARHLTAGPGSANATPAVVAQAAPLNRLAAVSFVAALFLGLVVAPLTLPLSCLAKRQIRLSGEGGASLALAATLISVVYLVIGLVVVGLYAHLSAAGFLG